MKKIHLDFAKQLDLFIERGLSPPKNRKLSIEALANLNYYKIKEIARPFMDKKSQNVKNHRSINRWLHMLRNYIIP